MAESGGTPKMDEQYFQDWRNQMRAFVRGKMFGKSRSVVNTSDILQESLIQVWQNSDQLEKAPEASRKSWGYKVVLGKMANVRRYFNAKKRAVAEERNVDVGFEPEEPIESLANNETYLRLVIAIRTLPMEQQSVLCQVIFDDQSFAEIARQTDHTPSQIRRTYLAAIDRLQEICAE